MNEQQGLYNPAQEHDACGVGFVARIDGEAQHAIIQDGIQILRNLVHRGAVGGDGKTGDGVGMLFRIPHAFFAKTVNFALPAAGSYGTGMTFLSRDEKKQTALVALVERVISEEKGAVLGWRDVPHDPDCLGQMALDSMPMFRQVFLEVPGLSGDELEIKLYIIRKRIENAAIAAGYDFNDLYFASFSSVNIVYKGMYLASHFTDFYPDLLDSDVVSPFVLIHQRYSTNTFPSWQLAQPFRNIAHNGEINTIRRNINNMKARESSLSSELFKEDLPKIFPVVNDKGSDSAIFDNVFEFLRLGGRTPEHALIMMIPEAFGTKYHISQDKRAFFEYHASIMEPWDGPAALMFTDGRKIGATLDRNGLRPIRYVVTKTGKIVVASEVGVLEFPPAEVREKGRLAPGKMLMVDLEQQRLIYDNEIKSTISRRKPYRRWLEENKIELKGLFQVPGPVGVDKTNLALRQKAFGYSLEDLKMIIAPMANNAQEPISSMGNDESAAVLSRKPQLLYNYFKQLFAQVTNPPIDPYRENLVMSLMSFVGREKNLLDETPQHCRQLKLSHPVLTNDDIQRLKTSDLVGFQVASVSMLFNNNGEPGGLKKAVEELCRQVESAIDAGASLVILSDRGISETQAAIPALLATGGVHHYLVAKGKRHLSGLVLETAEAREVHHFSTLIGYGASGINPYLVFESLVDLKDRGYLDEELSLLSAMENYITAVKKGLFKVMSKMGISTIRSYRGSQIYEAIGLNSGFIDRYFNGTTSQIEGVGVEEIERETLERHNAAYRETDGLESILVSGGKLHYRMNSQEHLFTAKALTLLQKSVRTGDYAVFKEYVAEINDVSRSLCTLRGLFRFKTGTSVPLSEVEPATEIVKRFFSSAMSFGSLSREAHEAIAIAMNRIGAHSNSGEGGEDEARYKLRENGDNPMSMVKQIASGRFGVTSNYLVHSDELQIKMAQGAKPGEGGQLPGHKVNDVIARVRNSTPGVGLISPPPHHDIYSIEDLAQLIFDLKNGNPAARVSVKLVSEVGVGTIAAGVAKGKADMVQIAGTDGGTGSSPISSIKHAGTYWEVGLAETQQVLVRNRLREKIRVQVDGQLKTGRDIVIGALLGAEEFGFATTCLVSLGCVLMRKCHLNSCPVGIATQNTDLRKRFRGKPEHLVNFMMFLAENVREHMAELGFRTFQEMVGQVQLLETTDAIKHYKTRGLDFSRVLMKPEVPEGGTLHCTGEPEHNWSLSVDPALIEECVDALEKQEKVRLEKKIRNFNRTAGAMLSSEVSRRYGSEGLPADTIHVKFNGSAGQSFGAFLAPGITFELEGDANDYYGKGLSGGRLIIYPPAESTFRAERNSITGNVNLFGATGGEVFINGMAGERFCVRNSGAIAVVEGVGDHGCEYMTGGRVIVLGSTGVNFAAGMSGGIAYVYDENQLFDTRCNLELVDVEPILEEADKRFLKTYVQKHSDLTGSKLAASLLERWEEALPSFVKVMPLDYRKAMERIKDDNFEESENVEMTEEVY